MRKMRIASQAALLALSGIVTGLLSACGGDGSSSSSVRETVRTLTTLKSFAGVGPSDYAPAEIVAGTDGNLYGVILGGGANGEYVTGSGNPDFGVPPKVFEPNTAGTAVKMTPTGEVTVIWNFGNDATDGLNPVSLIEGSDGNLYGTTFGGGVNGGLGMNPGGTVFQLTPTGVETVLASFGTGVGRDLGPNHLVEGVDGSLYGITGNGGVSRYVNGAYVASGTVFKVTPQGVMTELWNFSADGDGASPTTLVKGADGNLYGTTQWGGTIGYGTLFKLTTAGTETVVWSFCEGADGCGPNALLQGSDGNLYGTTQGGGANHAGTIFQFNPATGVLTRLWDFAPGVDQGVNPSGLAQGADGNLYGTTDASGLQGSGTGGVLFELSQGNKLTTLGIFNGRDVKPYSLVQGRDGYLYGVTAAGGTYNKGTLFRY